MAVEAGEDKYARIALSGKTADIIGDLGWTISDRDRAVIPRCDRMPEAVVRLRIGRRNVDLGQDQISRAGAGKRFDHGRAGRPDFNVAEIQIARRKRTFGIADPGAVQADALRAVIGVVRYLELADAIARRCWREGNVDGARLTRRERGRAVVRLSKITCRGDVGNE